MVLMICSISKESSMALNTAGVAIAIYAQAKAMGMMMPVCIPKLDTKSKER